MQRTTFRVGLAVVALALSASRAAAGGPKCFSASRQGHCVVVELNGQRSAKISKKTKKALKDMGALEYHGEEARYEIPAPVRGALDLRADFVPEAASFFGGGGEFEAQVVPLEGQSLDTDRQRAADPTVRVGGSPVVTEENVLRENRLPPGRYLMAVRLRGPANWDRQVVFFQVVE
jgi:hypothetical protein